MHCSLGVVVSKQSWIFSARLADCSMSGWNVCCALQMWAWNKVALLQKVLKETPPERAPWILYMQPDTIIDDTAFTFPFDLYQGKHWVSVGDANSVKQGWASGASLSSALYLSLSCISTTKLSHALLHNL